ncbi:hypothetical protein FGO68_gene9308 [Halteria grandinella]|uniref:Fumarylacetoacetase-like C-terminal domain-containing protein n=1 Tax=Halteria grandinella TaxID=5974 RepID=A0A8J8NIM9_HALGN|nr:hypothetical protein FGO68_gene9308 [Halteria grandinella]
MSAPAPYLLFNEVLKNKNTTRKCLGIAKNYFTKSLKNDPSKVVLPKYPLIFSKTLSALQPKNSPQFKLPKDSVKNQINHEVELGVMLKKGGGKGEGWKNCIGGYFLLLDYSDGLQAKNASEKGTPWFMAKAQDGFLMLSDLIPVEAIEDPHQVELELTINGETRQRDVTGNMHYKLWEQLDYINQYLTLGEGDILMTGTPEGLGPVNEGDKMECWMTYKGKELARIKQDIVRDTV